MTRLDELVEIFDGPHATPTRRTEGAYFLNIASLKAGRLDLSESDRVSDEDFVKWTRRVQPRAGDLLFSYETRLGEAALMPAEVRECLGRRMALMRIRTGKVVPRYLLYFYLSPEFQSLIAERAIHGATVSRIPLKEMGSWAVELPDLPTQTAIADLLGALDDKIAANDRVVASLDALVRAEVERYANGDTARIGELAQLGTQKWNGSDAPVAYLGLEHLPRRVLWPSEFGSSADVTSQKSHFEPGDLLFGKLRPYFHKVVVAPCAGVCSTDILVLRARDAALAGWMWAVVSSDSVVAAVTAGSTGTRMPRASWTELAEVSVPWPGRDRAVELSQMIEQLSAKARAAIAESRQLAATRDALLPELMSGRLGVLQSSR